jgi:hypothetical protein
MEDDLGNTVKTKRSTLRKSKRAGGATRSMKTPAQEQLGKQNTPSAVTVGDATDTLKTDPEFNSIRDDDGGPVSGKEPGLKTQFTKI